MDALLAALTVITDLKLFLLVGVGTFAGVYIGAIPGLSVTMAVSILISFTFSWEVYPALALMIGIFMGGAVVVESVFGWPGIGQLAWQAIQRVDIPIIMGVTVVSAVAIVLGNLLADMIAPFVDPRIKLR